MLSADEPVLSLSEWIVLSLVLEQPTYAYALAVLLSHDGELGRIWHVQKAEVYRSLDRLEQAGLIRPAGSKISNHGPVRSLVEITEAGRATAADWQQRPVKHARDIRSELLVKLALLDRSGANPHDLLVAQHTLLLPIADALRDRVVTATGFDRTVLLWRYETASAAIRFLDALVTAIP